MIGAISAIGPVQFMAFIILDHNRVEFKQIAQDGVVLHAIHCVMVPIMSIVSVITVDYFHHTIRIKQDIKKLG